MIKHYNTTLYVRNHIAKSGLSAIYLQVNIANKIKNYHLKQYVDIKYWDNNKKVVKANYPNAFEINFIITKEKQHADEIFLDLRYKEKEINFLNFETVYIGGGKDPDFYEFARNEIERKKINLAPGTYRSLLSELTKLKKYRPILTLSEMDLEFIKNYEYYMRNELKNKVNTVSKTLKRIKTLLNIALEKELISKSPFIIYKLKHEKTNRTYLTDLELERIESIAKNNTCGEKIQRVAYLFLFSCYTGLRFTDIQHLTSKQIRENKYIELEQQKTGEIVTIPLTIKALNILSNLIIEEDGTIFKKISNQKANDYLKALAVFAQIEKEITFHTARHTFATISLNLGIPIEVVSTLLGHTEIRTTQVYAKIMNTSKFEHMKKWDE